MAIEVKGLGALDPRAVPLPAGTEVSTTVDRPAPSGDRVVPQGAVGRVARIDGDRVTVLVIGVGEVEYARSEVLPRKQGQLRFAARRAEAEAALGPCAILEAVVGSRAWGLAEEGSDTDVRGAFLFPFPWTTGLVEVPDVWVSADGSRTFWELGRTVRQLLRADPNTLEMLFVPTVEAKTPVGALLLAEREAFVSAEIYGAFGRYALSQAKKLSQSLRLARHRALLIEWLAIEPTLSLDAAAARLASETLGGAGRAEVMRAKEYIKQLYRSMYDQGLIEAAELAALGRFAATRAAELELPRELRPKNAYNLLRLVSSAVTWLETGAPLIETRGALRDRLLAIKRGEVPLETALEWTEAEAERLEAARERTVLPPRPDVARAERVLRAAREEAARHFLEARPGPWGVDAPPPPAPEGASDA